MWLSRNHIALSRPRDMPVKRFGRVGTGCLGLVVEAVQLPYLGV